jgi:hypothetical protein
MNIPTRAFGNPFLSSYMYGYQPATIPVYNMALNGIEQLMMQNMTFNHVSGLTFLSKTARFQRLSALLRGISMVMYENDNGDSLLAP